MSADTKAKLQAHLASAPTYEVAGRLYRGTLPRILCGDGTTMSVQASSGHYCSPRESEGPWWAVEIGYPSRRLDGLMEWAEAPLHPADFYVAHRLFIVSRRGEPTPEWGGLTEGPADLTDVLREIGEWAGSPVALNAPSPATLRVWHFQPDVPARDVTEDVLERLMVGEAA